MDESERDTKIEETETDKLTETDPFKPHEGVPRQDEPENKKEPGKGKKVEANFLVESVGAESSSGELEVPETDQLTETDPVKPHEGLPMQHEPDNVKGPGHGKKSGAKILKESVEAESSFEELPSEESDLQLAAVYPSRHGCPSRCPQNTRRQLKLKLLCENRFRLAF